MRFFLYLFLWAGLLAPSCSEKMYVYEVPVLAGTEPSRLLDFERSGTTGEETALVHCRIVDLTDQQPMSNTVVIFTKSAEQTTLAGITNESGFFEKKLPAGAYDMEVRYTGKNTFRQPANVLEAGGQYELSIGLGDSGTPVTRKVKSAVALTPEQARDKAEAEEIQGAN